MKLIQRKTDTNKYRYRYKQNSYAGQVYPNLQFLINYIYSFQVWKIEYTEVAGYLTTHPSFKWIFLTWRLQTSLSRFVYDMTNNAKNKDELNVDKSTIVFICRYIFILGNTGRQPKPALLKKYSPTEWHNDVKPHMPSTQPCHCHWQQSGVTAPSRLFLAQRRNYVSEDK